VWLCVKANGHFSSRIQWFDSDHSAHVQSTRRSDHLGPDFICADHDFSVEANSLERIQSYIDIDKEPEATESGKPPAYWPASGDLRVENLTARYSVDGPIVLDKLSFHIKSGERVGVGESTGRPDVIIFIRGLICLLSGPNRLGQEHNDTRSSPMHLYRRRGVLRRPPHVFDQPGCSSLEHHHHPSGGSSRLTVASVMMN
jgi:hypothetical protein